MVALEADIQKPKPAPRHIDLAPLVEGAPFIGNIREMMGDPARFFYESYRKLGPVFRFKMMGRTNYVIAGADAAKLIDQRGEKNVLRSREFWEGQVEEFGSKYSLVRDDGEVHERLRAILKRSLSRDVIAGRYGKAVEILNTVFERDWRPGTTIPVTLRMQRLVSELIGLIVAGAAPGDYAADIRTFIKYMLMTKVVHQAPDIILNLPFYQDAKRRSFEFAYQLIEDYKRNGPSLSDGEGVDFIGEVLEAHEKYPDLVPASDLPQLVLAPYVAGLDTVANVLGSALYALLKNPEVMARMRAEVDAVDTLDEAALRKMQVTQGVMMETLRIYPINVAGARAADVDFEFAGYHIPQGTKLFCATTVTHFMPEFYPEPAKFDIDRYQPPRREHMKPFAFSPFARGPHTCLGQGLAEILIMLTLAQLVRKVDVSLDPADYEMKISAVPTPGPSDDFKVRVEGYRS
jgi:cytochrome P450